MPEPQRTPHEGGNGAPGLPRTVHESAKPPPEKRPRGRPRLEEVQLQFSREAWRYTELTSFFERRRNTRVQQPQPEGEPTPSQPKRRVGSMTWDKLTYEEKTRRLKRQGGLILREFHRKQREEMHQIKAALSEEELRDVKRLRKYVRAGAKSELTRRSEDSVVITIWPQQKERK